jgi:hypothetical protein
MLDQILGAARILHQNHNWQLDVRLQNMEMSVFFGIRRPQFLLVNHHYLYYNCHFGGIPHVQTENEYRRSWPKPFHQQRSSKKEAITVLMFWQRTSRIWILEHHEVIPSHKRICLQLDMGLVVGTVKSSLVDLSWTKVLVHPIQSQQHKYESELKTFMTGKTQNGQAKCTYEFPTMSIYLSVCRSFCLSFCVSICLSIF